MASGTEAAKLLGDRVRSLRQSSGRTQMDFALYVGMNVAHLGRIERGQGNPNLETLVRLADALKVDVGDLVRGIGVEHFPPLPEVAINRDYLDRKRRIA